MKKDLTEKVGEKEKLYLIYLNKPLQERATSRQNCTRNEIQVVCRESILEKPLLETRIRMYVEKVFCKNPLQETRIKQYVIESIL